MDRRIQLLSVTTTQDTAGGPVEATSPLATVWAEAKDLLGREFTAAQQTNAEITTRFRIRYRADLTPQHRIAWDGRSYDIVNIAEIGRREGLEINARARV